jgi:lipopolysaccharide/colanic/teichoic acid biosynthesis glycosyltransferase
MGAIIALGVVVASIIGAALSQQLADELKAWTPWLAEYFVKHAIRRLPQQHRERYGEEWHAHIDEIPGQIGKLFVALGFVIASVEIARRASRKATRRSDLTASNHERKTGRVELTVLPEVWRASRKATRRSGPAVSDYERKTGQVELTVLPEVWPFASQEIQTPFLRAEKRIFDVAVSLAAIVWTSLVMALTAFAIWIEDGGPVLYCQTRIGLNGKEFAFYKFRSMRVDAEHGGSPLWAAENDPRITRVGSIIRKFHIDELPQFFNTLRGDMSFIGPRPERPYFVEQLADVIPCYKARHTVKPGITGWAQVSYHYGASFEDAYQKAAFDLYYVKHQSVLLDLIILARTVMVVLWPTRVNPDSSEIS